MGDELDSKEQKEVFLHKRHSLASKFVHLNFIAKSESEKRVSILGLNTKKSFEPFLCKDHFLVKIYY